MAITIVTSLLSVASALSLQRLPNTFRRNAHPAGSCVVFHSQHKSGGSTLNKVLKYNALVPKNGHCSARVPSLFECDMKSWNCKLNTCIQEDYQQWVYPWSNAIRTKDQVTLDECGSSVAYQGYTPVLVGSEWGSPGDGRCAWITVSREPVARLVSAFFYCRQHVAQGLLPVDPLCGVGSSMLHFDNASIQDFAQYWGNFLLRELLWHPELYKIAASRPDFNGDFDGDCTGSASDSTGYLSIHGQRAPWQNLKLQLNGGDDPRTQSGASNMEAVEKYLRAGKFYDVNGILEDMDHTLQLFDSWAPLANNTWRRAADEVFNSHGSEDYKGEEETTLANAKKDPVVLDALAGDIHLYQNVIVPIFMEQVRELR